MFLRLTAFTPDPSALISVITVFQRTLILSSAEIRCCKILAGPERVPTMGQRYPPGYFGKIKGLFQGGITAAHDNDVFAPEEKTVASSAVRNSFAIIFRFAGNANFLGLPPVAKITA